MAAEATADPRSGEMMRRLMGDGFFVNAATYPVVPVGQSGIRFIQSLHHSREQLCELLEVGDLLHQPVRELSLGERMKMELIAALLHSPRVLFLDEPTIGLDVVAQAGIRKCLREYNREKRVTILLTSHYMQDIEALCDRVIVINQGRIVHDGALSEIVERLAGHKVVTIQFHDGRMPPGIESFGDVTDFSPPRVTMRWDRRDLPERAAKLLADYQIDDISVQDPPIEEVIAEMYRTGLTGLEHPNRLAR